jgi:hypothetical protein
MVHQGSGFRQGSTFFGLARTYKARFPFLFGVLRLPITASQLLSKVPPWSWESRGLIGMPFTIDAVTQLTGR